MANVLLFKTITCPTSERKDIQSLLKNFQLQDHFSGSLVWSTILFSRHPVFVFFKKFKCFTLKQVQYVTVSISKEFHLMKVFPAFSIPMSISLQIPIYPVRLKSNVSCRCRPSSVSSGRTSPFSFYPTLSTLYPAITTITLHDGNL